MLIPALGATFPSVKVTLSGMSDMEQVSIQMLEEAGYTVPFETVQ